MSGWSTVDYLTAGVRKVKIYFKYNRSFTDEITVEDPPDTGKFQNVEGTYLFVKYEDALARIASDKQKELDDVNYAIFELQQQIKRIEAKYDAIVYEVPDLTEET